MTAWYRELDARGRRGFWTTYAGFSVDAMSVQVYAFILPTLLLLWDLTPASAGFLATATLFAGAFGGSIAGWLADRFGRLRILRISILWVAFSSVLCGLASNYDQLLLARVLQGIGFGAEWAVGAVFVGEIAAASSRGRVAGIAQSAWATGWALAAAVSAAALAMLPPELGWRATFFVGLVPAIAVHLVRRGMPEPAVFTVNGAALPWRRIFAPDMRKRTLAGSVVAIGTHGGYWAIATWWPAMLRLERGLSEHEATVHIAAMIAGSFGGYILGAWLSDRAGRRATLAIFAAGGIAVVLAATHLPMSASTLLAMSAPLGFFALGIYSAISPALAELFPTSLRGSGLGFCYNVGRGIAGLAPLAVGGSMTALGLSHAIGIYVTASYLLIIVGALVLPETRGIALDDAALPQGAPGQ